MRKKNLKNKNVYMVELDITLIPKGKMREVFEKANPNRDGGYAEINTPPPSFGVRGRGFPPYTRSCI